MGIVKIARREYQRARKTDLAAFSANVVARMENAPGYQTLQPQVQALITASETYARTVAAARNQGIGERWARDLAQNDLIKVLDTLAQALETLANDDTQLVIDAGFSLYQNSTKRYSGRLSAPVIVKAGSTGRKGEVRVSVTDEFPQVVRTHAVEVSFDQGQTWRSSAFNSYRNFVLSGLAYSPEMWLRVAAVGSGYTQSPWSEVAVVTVV